MWSKREIIIFFTGAQAFHTLSHILIGMSDILPIKFIGINWTSKFNIYAIIINGIITLGLFYWAEQNREKCK